MLTACASKQAKVAASSQGRPIPSEKVSIDVPGTNPGKEIVGDSTRPSWVYYQYGLQAIDNHEWAVSKHYLEESLRLLVTEKYDPAKSRLTRSEDSIYKMQMPVRIVQALEDVYPNLSEQEGDDSTYVDSLSIDGVDAYDENAADSASIRVIENFLDTVDAGRFSLPIRFNERVMQEIYYMTTTARGFITRSLTRKTAYDSLIYTKLAQKRMPRDLIYLALVESGFNVKAYSRAKAAGMWQFIPETGIRYGLEVDFWVDMRRNPEVATDAALSYLSTLYAEFGDWLLSMAAYNCGEGRIRRLIREKKADSTWGDRPVTYWDLQLPQETMHYVPRILAAMVIGHFPDHYDVAIEKRHLPAYDTVTVYDSFSLDEIAKFLKVPEDTLRTLNMELTMWCTPPNRDAYLLRLPYGTRASFVQNYDRMEKNGFSSWKQHKVRKGESIGNIAQQYGVRVAEIQRANDMKKNAKLKVGRTLLIPVKVAPRRSTGKKPSKVRTYVVQLGDNLGSISRRFGVSQESLRVWNNIEPGYNVKKGDTIYVSKPDLKPSSFVQQRVALKKGEKYVVKAGDTYALIAKQYKVPVFLLLQANSGFTKRLTIGDSLSIPAYVRPPRKMSKAVDDDVPVIETSKVTEPTDSKKSNKNSKKTPEPTAKNSKSQPVSTTIIYTVESGDNLYAIARKYSTTVAAIREMNDMGSSSNIKVGQKLKIPGSAAPAPSTPKIEEITHVVKKGEGLWDISRQYGVTIEDIVKWNGLKDTKIKINEKLKIKTTKKNKK
ncbi:MULTISPECIES: LysM peptidoglycan-binding domain-containing protein [unclassified Fibrobacter]|uniref:LysM peptidoglycan-binding domain-containing protein n=1 Tax=unclassified Fibrobacter TaxID=2634177 RepID=UPI0009229D4C|nr:MULTISPECIES: LysM peptidoglycan-binding domain-containing protein [unclassified Fibrobacter]SHK69865.1 membrane-bound lytic murein transglycosylase D [Fibrobacter sp. UWB12]SIO02347.1 membrane-bound lytic murein transglycosylase D [Fibrobacter sp. UWB11]